MESVGKIQNFNKAQLFEIEFLKYISK
uniref:Uncharacterized protein n=1 Tax=Anguilla anguilla TaxID=7936 RepID=A0A0E9PGM4_ANGAN